MPAAHTNPHHTLTIPDITGLDTLAAAFAYANAGWHIGPVAPRTKHPGSILGRNWQSQTTRDPEIIADTWLTHPNAGIFLHVGRSGGIVIDVDTPTKLPDVLTDALTEHPAPYQRTRRNDAARRHYIYTQPTGRTLGNGLGNLPTGWGDLRGANGVIIVAPSTHPDPNGHYAWGRTGPVPPLPDTIATLLTDTTQPVDVATDTRIRDFITTHNRGTDHDKAAAMLATYRKYVHNGDSRHQRAISILTGMLKEAAAGYYPAAHAEQQLRTLFLDAVTQTGTSPKQGTARTHPQALDEWRGILAWSIAQADHADPATTIDRTEDVAPRDLASLIDTRPAPTTPTPAAEATQEPLEDHTTPESTPAAPDDLTRLLDPAQATTGPTPTWQPVDLTAILDGTWTALQPTLFTRTDGIHLFYPGLVHNIYGESESGKSWVAQAAATQALDAGHRVAYIDFESGPAQVVGRLRAIGATRHQLNPDTFAYIRPEAAPASFHEAPAFAELLNQQWDLVILDGVTEALVMSGKATIDNDEITAWMRAVPRRIATDTGAAVVLIDHVVKATEGRGRFPIGGQAKMATIDGASYLAEPAGVLGAGLDGAIRLRIGKDREGQVRPRGGAWRSSDRTQEIALIRVDSTAGDGTTIITIQPPENGELQDRDPDRPFRPTKVMEKVSKILETMREPLSRKTVIGTYRETGNARDQTIGEALNLLVEGGHIIETTGPRGARMFRSATVYRSTSDPLSDDYRGDLHALETTSSHDLVPPDPTSARDQVGPLPTTSSRPPLPLGGSDEVRSPKDAPEHATSSRTPDHVHINTLTGEIHAGPEDPQW